MKKNQNPCLRPPTALRRPVVTSASRVDVARLAGVSPAAVSQVLNNHPSTRISPAVREKIVSAAQQLGYRPNPVARALTAGRTAIIGVLIFHVGSPFNGYSSNILNTTMKTLQASGNKMLIDCRDVTADISELFRESGWCDGYIILASPLELKGAELIPGSKTPCVFVGSVPDGLAASYVDMDNRQAARQVVSHLIAMGHRAIAHISGPADEISSAKERLVGYREVLAEHGLPYDERLVVDGRYLYGPGRLAMAELLRRHVPFTALFSGSDAMAQGAVAEMRAFGLDVPGDVSIAGIDDLPPASGAPYDQLTTIRQPFDEIGVAAASILLELLAMEPAARQPIVRLLPGTLIERQTVAPPRQGGAG